MGRRDLARDLGLYWVGERLIRLHKLLFGLGVLVLAGCSTPPSVDSPQAMIDGAIYRHDGPPSLTLFTMISNRSNSGAHLGIMVNGSQRVIFDPAGDFAHPLIAERGDVIYGITPQMKRFYIGVHARETYRVLAQTIEVSPAVAEQAMR